MCYLNGIHLLEIMLTTDRVVPMIGSMVVLIWSIELNRVDWVHR